MPNIDHDLGRLEQTPIAQAAARYLARRLVGAAAAAWREAAADPLGNAAAGARRCGDGGAMVARWPNANVGIVTGEISNLIVLDVDPKHGGDDSLAELERRFECCPKPSRRTPAAAAAISISPIPAASCPIAPGWRRASTCAATAVTSWRRRRCIRADSLYAWAPGRSPEEIGACRIAALAVVRRPRAAGAALARRLAAAGA